MAGILVVIVLLVASLASMTAGIVINRLSPSYDTALAIPLFNLDSAVEHGIGGKS